MVAACLIDEQALRCISRRDLVYDLGLYSKFAHHITKLLRQLEQG